MRSISVDRELQVAANALKRLYKEYKYYVVEADKQRERVDKMIQDNADSYDIKKQREVLDESLQMISDSKRRFEETRQKVSGLVTDPSLTDDVIVEAAKTILADTA